MDDIRRQIEYLMGEIEAPIENKNVHDDDVCKFYLCGLCPHELFENTKYYMGPCKNIHSEVLREKYFAEREKKWSSYKYERDSLRVFQGMVDDCNKKIERNRVRAELSGRSKLEDENIRALDIEIKEIMKEIDDLGASGDIDGSLKRMEDLTRLNQQKMKISATKEDVENGMYRQKLHPCEICAAFLSETDNDQRLNDHFKGKIHAGYLKIRKHAKDLKEWLRENLINRGEHNKYEGSNRNESRSRVHRYHHTNESRYSYHNGNRDRRYRDQQDYREQNGFSMKRERHPSRCETTGGHRNNRFGGSSAYNYFDSKQRHLNHRSHPFSTSDSNKVNNVNNDAIEVHSAEKSENNAPSDGEVSRASSNSSRSFSRSLSPI
ncbi:Luc7-related protein [Cryptosporidium felis]|nr:Luc7-related protein [Cryptosporidium felis]